MKDINMLTKTEKLNRLIANAQFTVFLGGAGVSTASGIPDFRGKHGLYKQKSKYPPETILSYNFFIEKPVEFYEYYSVKLKGYPVKPNIIHTRLAELEEAGKLKAVITQNVDGLHQEAGSKNVYEIHGSIMRNYCIKCKKQYDEASLIEDEYGVPRCECGGVIRPDIVLYEESLDDRVVKKATDAVKAADLLIIAGTSLTVNTAAFLVGCYRGKDMVIINNSETVFDRSATMVIRRRIEDVFRDIRV
jgi:NAD-dependent deacetylase